MTLRLGLIGAGGIAATHIRALTQVRGVEVAGIVSHTPPLVLAESIRERGLGQALVFETIEELANAVDVVAILSPNYARVETVRALAHAVREGAKIRAIACEKPLARNLIEADEVLAFAKETAVQTIFLENQLHMPGLRDGLACLSPSIAESGPMTFTRSAEQHAGPHSPWFWDPVLQGGGVLSDMGCHAIALAWYLLTPPSEPINQLRPVRVSAQVGLLKWGRPEWRKELQTRFAVDLVSAPVEDFATGLITFRDSASGIESLAQFNVSWINDRPGLRLIFEGLGPGYSIEMDNLRLPLDLYIGNGVVAAPHFAPLAVNEDDLYGYVDEWRDLVHSVETGTPPLADWSYGREIVYLTMACYMAAERRKSIDLEDPATKTELQTYIPLIQQGKGSEVLYPSGTRPNG
ncbi:MAG: Gfo/Idh/MocA family protein [Acidimicrobiia bacterium]